MKKKYVIISALIIILIGIVVLYYKYVSPYAILMDNNSSESAKRSAMYKLAATKSDRAFDAIVKYGLNDKSESIRCSAIFDLSKNYREKALPVLGKRLFLDTSALVIACIISEIGDIGSEKGIPYLEKILNNDKYLNDPKYQDCDLVIVRDLGRINQDKSLYILANSRYLMDGKFRTDDKRNGDLARLFTKLDSDKFITVMINILEPVELVFKSLKNRPYYITCYTEFVKKRAGTDFGIEKAIEDEDKEAYKASFEKIKKWWDENKDKYPKQFPPGMTEKEKEVKEKKAASTFLFPLDKTRDCL